MLKEVSTYLRCAQSLRQSDTDKSPSRTKKVAIMKLKPLDATIQAAMKKSEKDLQRELGVFHHPEQADFQDRVTINKHEFTTYCTSESHGIIFFQEAGGVSTLVPGIVHAIFLVRYDSVTHIFLAVHRYLMPTPSLPNPFAVTQSLVQVYGCQRHKKKWQSFPEVGRFAMLFTETGATKWW